MDDLALAGWNARQHDVRTGRTRKGRTTQEVTRYGAAVVTGALTDDSEGLPLLAASPRDSHVLHPSAAAARQLLMASERDNDVDTRREHHTIGRKRYGLSALDVLRITEATYRDHGLPPLLTGTEVRQFEQVIHRDRAAQARVTAHSVGIDGGRQIEIPARLVLRPTCFPDGSYAVSCTLDTTIGEIVRQSDANVPQTSSLKAMPTRGMQGDARFGRLPLARRNSDPMTAVELRDATHGTRQFKVAADGTCEECERVVIVVAADEHTEHLWQGHAHVERQPAIVRTETARADRTTITATPDAPDAASVERPTNEQGWARLLRKLDPGKRADLGTITCTVGKPGKRGTMYRATVRDAEGSRYMQAWSAEGLAHQLAAV